MRLWGGVDLESRLLRAVLWSVLVSAAVASTWRGVANAVDFSVDFQVSAAAILLDGDDPYVIDVSGDPDGRLDSGVHYLHLLYVLMLPLALLEQDLARVAWALVNLSLALIACVVVARALRLSRGLTVGLILVALASDPLRVTIGNAQMSLIVVAFAAILMLPATPLRTAISGISSIKWSFAPPFALLVLLRRGPRALLLWLTPAALGAVVFATLVRDASPATILRPILRQLDGPDVAIGSVDLMTILKLAGVDGSARVAIPAVVMLLSSLMIVRSFQTERYSVPALVIVSLVTVNHLPYDFVALVPALAAGLAHRREAAGRFIIVIVAYFFFGTSAKRLGQYVLEQTTGPDLIGFYLQATSRVGPTWPPNLASAVIGMVAMSGVIVALRRLERSGPSEPSSMASGGTSHRIDGTNSGQ